MEFFADWHTHSRYSDGRGTIEENVLAALSRGLDQLAVTDHGPRNIGVGVKGIESYLRISEEIGALNREYRGITIKAGAEADIIALDGTIDLPARIIDRLDILTVGLHPYVLPATPGGLWSVVGINQLAQVSRSARQKARINNTKALKEAVNKYDIDFISHPDLKMPVDIAELSSVCTARGVALEINTGHHYDKEELVRVAAKTGVNFVVNSDAHFPETVGDLALGGALLEKFKVEAERVLNARLM